jgi:hypothetical protein
MCTVGSRNLPIYRVFKALPQRTPRKASKQKAKTDMTKNIVFTDWLVAALYLLVFRFSSFAFFAYFAAKL